MAGCRAVPSRRAPCTARDQAPDGVPRPAGSRLARQPGRRPGRIVISALGGERQREAPAGTADRADAEADGKTPMLGVRRTAAVPGRDVEDGAPRSRQPRRRPTDAHHPGGPGRVEPYGLMEGGEAMTLGVWTRRNPARARTVNPRAPRGCSCLGLLRSATGRPRGHAASRAHPLRDRALRCLVSSRAARLALEQYFAPARSGAGNNQERAGLHQLGGMECSALARRCPIPASPGPAPPSLRRSTSSVLDQLRDPARRRIGAPCSGKYRR